MVDSMYVNWSELPEDREDREAYVNYGPQMTDRLRDWTRKNLHTNSNAQYIQMWPYLEIVPYKHYQVRCPYKKGNLARDMNMGIMSCEETQGKWPCTSKGEKPEWFIPHSPQKESTLNFRLWPLKVRDNIFLFSLSSVCGHLLWQIL